MCVCARARARVCVRVCVCVCVCADGGLRIYIHQSQLTASTTHYKHTFLTKCVHETDDTCVGFGGVMTTAGVWSPEP